MARRTSFEFRASLKGDRELERCLRKLRKPKADAVYRKALTLNAALLKRKTKLGSLSGQKLKVRSGETRRSVKVDPGGLPKSIAIGSNVEWAPPLEFGWKAKNIRARRWLAHGIAISVEKFPRAWVLALDRAAAAAGGK